jgi:site-specific DNA recombinase
VIDEPKAAIVKFIYESYLANVPDYIILQDVRKQGFHLTGRSAIKSILKNPLYISQQHVKAYKQLPGGLFAGNWPTIIDVITWNRVQDKLNYKPRTKVAITDEMPLRGVLLCHCGKHLTGAPSRNRTGQYYNYYKCNVASSHNNISVIKAHDQLNQLLRYLNVPGHIINSTKQASEILLEQKEKENFNLLDIKRRDLEIVQKKLRSVEEKFINEQIDFETYSAWRGEITHKKNLLTVEIRNLDKDKNQLYLLLQKNLQPLTDMQYIYTIATTLQKQQLIRYVFDSSLYYQNKTYRTPYIMPIFSHNKLILKEKKLLIVDDINPNWSNSPVMWTPQDHNRTHTQLFDFLEFIESLHVA